LERSGEALFFDRTKRKGTERKGMDVKGTEWLGLVLCPDTMERTGRDWIEGEWNGSERLGSSFRSANDEW
jgi:hypothetical protein